MKKPLVVIAFALSATFALAGCTTTAPNPATVVPANKTDATTIFLSTVNKVPAAKKLGNAKLLLMANYVCAQNKSNVLAPDILRSLATKYSVDAGTAAVIYGDSINSLCRLDVPVPTAVPKSSGVPVPVATN